MQKQSALLAVGALILLAALGVVVPQLLGDTTPIVRWDAAAELDVPQEPADPQAATNADDTPLLERTEAPLPEAPLLADERVDLLMRGRVVDKFRGPVPQATVWLDFGRGGPRGGNNRQRRVPDPVTTDGDGRFAFQGQTFRNLRVSLQVAHARYAPAMFDKDVGAVATELDLGELTLLAGGQIRGRVTDLDGNGIAVAELRLQPENDNPLRWLRDREKLVAPFQTDVAGYYVRDHVASGAWALTAVAKAHTEGRSPTFVVEEEFQIDVDDIRLGPGFEVTGYVRNQKGEPIAKANVTMQSESRQRGGAAPGAPAAASPVAANPHGG
ncbi:MAG: carboxypeptidase regulatory-like domain-containing protein, partial [Planctomycetes bacterium]|nr:carboxypeptidase regulatory-like domain-containing protein [Planctomycetota bacterium]